MYNPTTKRTSSVYTALDDMKRVFTIPFGPVPRPSRTSFLRRLLTMVAPSLLLDDVLCFREGGSGGDGGDMAWENKK